MGNTYRELIKQDIYVPYTNEKYPFQIQELTMD